MSSPSIANSTCTTTTTSTTSPIYILAETLLQQNTKFYPDQYVWVCKSKGLKKKKKKNNTKQEIVTNNKKNDFVTENEQQQQEEKEERSSSQPHEQRSELFLRAQVIGYESSFTSSSSCTTTLKSMTILPQSDDDLTSLRVRVRYPKGSTYACHPHHLIPVYSIPPPSSSSISTTTTTVLVSSETKEYRRLCVIHTLQSFLEIGCDYGVTVHRVYTQGQISQVWGIDKSAESIAIARQNYPHLSFYLGDVLEEDEENNNNDNDATSSSSSKLPNIQPEVVGIDINGNRELPAVQQCIQIMIKRYQPRLIIVKSRALASTLSS